MTELDKALEWWFEPGDEYLKGCVTAKQVDHISDLAHAARRFASLTSPETIEKAAQVLYEQDWGSWDHATEPSRNHYRKVADAVLRAVSGKEGTG